MIYFIKGSPKKLSGTAIIYAELTNEVYAGDSASYGSPSIRAVIGSHDAVKYAEYLGLEDAVKKEFEKLYKSVRLIEKLSGENSPFQICTPFLSSTIKFNPETDIPKNNYNDIIYTGSWTNVNSCLGSLQMALQLYHINLAEQLKKGIVVFGRNNDSNLIKSENSQFLRYDSIAKDDAIVQMTKLFIGPMYHAKEKKDLTKFDKLKDDFLRFSAGSPFSEDVEVLVKILSKSDKGSLKLADRLVKKIGAVIAEDFTTAARLRDEVNYALSRISNG